MAELWPDEHLNAVSCAAMKTELLAAKVMSRAREVLAIESAAVAALANHIDDRFVAACRLIYDCTGRVVVTGMGKSGHIGDKIAATLASTGTPAFFLHAAEASHGDIGMIAPADVILALSNSGETAELVALLNARAACALEIGQAKQEAALALYQPGREAEVLDHVQALNSGPLDDGALRRLFERIIDEARRLERLADLQ